METLNAITALTALGHATRGFFPPAGGGWPGRAHGGRHRHGPAGAPATLSFHLKELVQAGLVESESQGRHVCYRANFDAMNGLIQYLTHNCCAGSPDQQCAASEPACRC